jgi:hypothetical protein
MQASSANKDAAKEGKKPAGAHAAATPTTSLKRIQRELTEIMLDPPANLSAAPKGDNLYEWVSTIIVRRAPPRSPLAPRAPLFLLPAPKPADEARARVCRRAPRTLRTRAGYSIWTSCFLKTTRSSLVRGCCLAACETAAARAR